MRKNSGAISEGANPIIPGFQFGFEVPVFGAGPLVWFRLGVRVFGLGVWCAG
jgi:hypothetical protein